MMKLSYVKKAILTAACIALCVVLPMAFHAIPNAGNIYCPMHMPVLLCGLVCGWPFGLLCGVAGCLWFDCRVSDAGDSHEEALGGPVYQSHCGASCRQDCGRGFQGIDFCCRKLFYWGLGHQLFCDGASGTCDSAGAAAGHSICAGEGTSDSGQVSQDSGVIWQAIAEEKAFVDR